MSSKVKYIIFTILVLIIIPIKVSAGKGCCSGHGGETGCTSDGRSICADGIISPSCKCTPSIIYGCTDSEAKNYNSYANTNDGSCMYYTYGCTDPRAKNYNPNVDKSDNSCEYYKSGCTDVNAKNYDSNAEKEDGSCMYYIYGCTDSTAKNYDSSAEKDDGSCEYYIMGCTDEKAINYNPEVDKDDGSCKYEQKRENPGIVRSNDQNINDKDNNDENNNNDNGIETVVPVLLLGGLGAGAYYETKKKKTEAKKDMI